MKYYFQSCSSCSLSLSIRFVRFQTNFYRMLFITLLVFQLVCCSHTQRTYWTVFILIRLYHLFFRNDACIFLLRCFVLSSVYPYRYRLQNPMGKITKSQWASTRNKNTRSFRVCFFPFFCLKWPKWIYIFYWNRACRSIHEHEHKYVLSSCSCFEFWSISAKWQRIFFRWFFSWNIPLHNFFGVLMLMLL